MADGFGFGHIGLQVTRVCVPPNGLDQRRAGMPLAKLADAIRRVLWIDGLAPLPNLIALFHVAPLLK